jgi:NADH:ubiquinone oxidoreductase subunit 5 (subunit L)/multisubunit Na+/H+ antiporter MnhA subunit
MTFFGPRRGDQTAVPPHESEWLMLGPMVALATCTVLGGIVVVEPAFLGVDREDWHPGVIAASLLLIVLGCVLTAAEWQRAQQTDPAASLGRLRRVLVREAGYDALVSRTVVRPVRWFAGVVRGNESEIVDGYADAGDTASQWGAQLVRWTHNGNAQRYLTAIAVGAVAVAVIVGVVGTGGPG